MSDADDLDSIRAEKRRRLLGQSATAEPAGAEDGSSETPAEPVHVRDAGHFRELTSTHDVVLVDYYADWCGPCQMLEPIVAEVARETDAAVAKVDVDAHQDLAAAAGVRGVPTLVLYKGGEPAERRVGVQDAGALRSLVDAHA